jgi:transcriptional regulator with XRE-family HTH domain
MSSREVNPDVQIAARFKQVREFLKLNQVQMGELCKISQPMVASIEKGVREIPVSVLKILFIEKNISPAFMFTGEEKMEYKSTKDTMLSRMIRDMSADMEVMKAEIKAMKKSMTFVNKAG